MQVDRTQIIAKIQDVAQKSGRTPTRDELAAAGLYGSLLRRTFGSYTVAVQSAGLQPRLPGVHKNAHRTPNTAVKQCSKDQRLDDPLPWPDWYFETNYLERAPTMAERANLQFKNHTP